MSSPPLLLTDDDTLVGEVGRLAAAAGVDLVVERGPGRGLGSTWSSAVAVLVGADVVEPTCESSPPRRDQVHVLCPGRAEDRLYRSAVSLGAASVLELPEAGPWLADLLADAGDGSVAGAVSVGVVGGGGGAGASTFAAALAVRAAGTKEGAGREVALVDLDPLGPGLQRVLGRDDPGVTWAGLAGSRGRLGARALRASLPRRDGVGVLGWGDGSRSAEPPSSDVLREAVSAARRGHDWVILDVPRSQCADLAPVLDVDRWLVVTRPGVSAVASALGVVAALRPVGGVGVVVRTRRGGPDPESVARVLGAPLVSTLGDHRRLDEHLDLGLGPVHGRSPFRAAADQVLSGLRGRTT